MKKIWRANGNSFVEISAIYFALDAYKFLHTIHANNLTKSDIYIYIKGKKKAVTFSCKCLSQNFVSYFIKIK